LEQHLHALAPLVARPASDDVDRLVERLGVPARRDLLQRPQPELGVAVPLQAGDHEPPPQLASLVEVEHRLGATPVVRGNARAGQRRPHVLLAPRQVLDGDPPQLTLEDHRASIRVRGHGEHSPLHAQPAPAPAAHRPDDDRAAAVDVAVEQAVERDHRVVVRGRRVDEVDDDPGLLAGRPSRDAADALLVDALGGGGRQVHADGRPVGVPPLGEELGVHQDVDLATLVRREDAGELALRRLARDAPGLHTGVLERLGDVVRVAHAGRVDDPG